MSASEVEKKRKQKISELRNVTVRILTVVVSCVNWIGVSSIDSSAAKMIGCAHR